jgi:cysteine-rich repeat protein
VDTDAGDILIRSLPFLPNDGFRPEIGTEPSSPVSVEFTVIDATSGIDPNSINVSITQNGSQLNDIDVSVRPCDDATPLNTCSPNGELDTEGFIVETEPQLLSPGDAEFRVRARNKAPSPQALEFRWTVRVLAAATPTRQPTATTVPTARPTPRPTFTATLVPTRTRRPSPVPTLSPTRQPTLTPSLTATITISPTPTATRTPKPPCSESISLNPCIPGGGTARTACYFEWLLDPVPERNNSFIPKSTTTCYEGDPECDSDGLINGICRFEVAMCINNLDPRFDSCRPTDLDTFEVLQPNPASPDGDFDAQNSAMLENEASNGFGVTIVRRGVVTDRGRPNATVGLCSPFLGINVRVGSERPGRDTLRIRNTTSDDESTSAAVTLRCAPSTCGNGTVEEQEECDDGNRRDGDGCDQGCQFEIGNGAAAVVGDPAGSAE